MIEQKPKRRPQLKLDDRVRVRLGSDAGRTGRVFSLFTDGMGAWLVLLDPKPGNREPDLAWVQRFNLDRIPA